MGPSILDYEKRLNLNVGTCACSIYAKKVADPGNALNFNFKLEFQWKLQFRRPSSVQCMHIKTGTLGDLFREETIVPYGPALQVAKDCTCRREPKSSCCVCTQRQTRPCNLLIPTLPIKIDRRHHDEHTCQLGAPFFSCAPRQPTKKPRQSRSWLWHPPPSQVGEAEVSSPAAAWHTPSTAKRPKGQSELTCGAVTHGKWASAKKSW